MRRWPGNARSELTSFGRMNRSELMKRVRSFGNKTTEIKAAKLLRQAGLTGWRRHLDLPGRPDFVWPAHRVALFIDGCFWHAHNCGKNIAPKTNAGLWQEKLLRNRTRDRLVNKLLRESGWLVLRLWECKLRREPSDCVRSVMQAIRANTAA
jgi:DNA mismatch endonuclease, patch repair protein